MEPRSDFPDASVDPTEARCANVTGTIRKGMVCEPP
jgi:hypothetical protein